MEGSNLPLKEQLMEVDKISVQTYSDYRPSIMEKQFINFKTMGGSCDISHDEESEDLGQTQMQQLEDLFPTEQTQETVEIKIKNEQKRCKDLERFQQNMSLNLYEQYCPLNDFYMSMFPKTWSSSKPPAKNDELLQIQSMSSNKRGLKSDKLKVSKKKDKTPLIEAKQMIKFKPKIKQKRLIINISCCRYPVVRKVAKYEYGYFLSARDMFALVNGQIVLDGTGCYGTSVVTNGLQRDPDDDYFDIFWMDTAGQRHLDRFSTLKPYQRINHFPGMHILCRKNELGKLLNQMAQKDEKEFNFFPRTWVLPRDQRSFECYIKTRKGFNDLNSATSLSSMMQKSNQTDPIFIVKPEAQCQGKGIFLIKDYKDLDGQISSFNSQSQANQNIYDSYHCVVQEYIEKPLLIDRMKFDLRLYVLLLGVDPLRIFLFKDGLARLATNAYQKPSDYNMTNMQMHLTNYAINKNSMAFMQNHTAVADFVGSKRSFKFVLRYLKNVCKADTTKLMKEIKDMIIKTMVSAQPSLAQNYKNYQIDDYENSMAFEILGFDIMLDEKCKPYLLEINHAPSFATDSPLDEKIKGQVIYDTINLLGLSQKRKKNYKNIKQMKIDLRKIQSKKTLVPQNLKDQFRKEFDLLRNQYEFRNKGMFEMIFPILDEITLDQNEEKMKPYIQLQNQNQNTFCSKNNIKNVTIIPIEKKPPQPPSQNKRRVMTPRSTQQFMKTPQKDAQQAQFSKIKEYYRNVKSRVFTKQPSIKQDSFDHSFLPKTSLDEQEIKSLIIALQKDGTEQMDSADVISLQKILSEHPNLLTLSKEYFKSEIQDLLLKTLNQKQKESIQDIYYTRNNRTHVNSGLRKSNQSNFAIVNPLSIQSMNVIAPSRPVSGQRFKKNYQIPKIRQDQILPPSLNHDSKSTIQFTENISPKAIHKPPRGTSLNNYIVNSQQSPKKQFLVKNPSGNNLKLTGVTPAIQGQRTLELKVGGLSRTNIKQKNALENYNNFVAKKELSEKPRAVTSFGNRKLIKY